jgi:hypothetical protein
MSDGMMSGNPQPVVIAGGEQVGGVGAVGVAAIQAVIDSSRGEVVQLGADVGDTARRRNGSYEFQDLARGSGHREWEDVLVAAQGVVAVEASDVRRVIEQAGPF